MLITISAYQIVELCYLVGQDRIRLVFLLKIILLIYPKILSIFSPITMLLLHAADWTFFLLFFSLFTLILDLCLKLIYITRNVKKQIITVTWKYYLSVAVTYQLQFAIQRNRRYLNSKIELRKACSLARGPKQTFLLVADGPIAGVGWTRRDKDFPRTTRPYYERKIKARLLVTLTF